MIEQRKAGKCRWCKQRVVVFRKGTNHILHLISCGAWSIVWIGVCIKIGGWRCSQCGGRARRLLA